MYAEIIVNGTSSARSDARTLDWSGNEVLAGKLTVGTAPSDDMDAATKKYVDEQVAGASGGTSTSADWSVTDSTATGYISNKPAIKAGTGTNSILEGSGKTASDSNCHAEGAGTVASKADAHAEGGYTTASGYYSHAEGQYSEASGSSSHAEGMSCKAQGMYSHAEGNGCTAVSASCHAEGNETQAKMSASHAEGYNTLASSNYQHVSGKFNVEDTNTTYVEIIGNGTSNMARSNARTLDWSGNEVLAGKLTVGAAPENDLDVATKKYVDDLIASLQSMISELSEKVNGTAS